MLDKAEVGGGERRMLQTVLGLPVDSSSEEEEEDEDDSDSDAGAEGKDVDDTPAVAVVDRAKVRAEIAALSTEPSAVLRMREELRQQAGTVAAVHCRHVLPTACVGSQAQGRAGGAAKGLGGVIAGQAGLAHRRRD